MRKPQQPNSIPHSEESLTKAYNKSLRYLVFRPRSIKETIDRLVKHGFEQITIDLTITRLLEQKFLNDTDFAKSWIESRQKYKGKSKFILKRELQKKGIEEEIIEKLLKESEDDFKVAKDLFERKKTRYEHLPKMEFKVKISQYLGRRGFSWDIIKEVLKEN